MAPSVAPESIHALSAATKPIWMSWLMTLMFLRGLTCSLALNSPTRAPIRLASAVSRSSSSTPTPLRPSHRARK